MHELVVGIPREDLGTLTNAGTTQILYGSVDGVSAAGNRFWHQDSAYVEGGAETNDHLGCVPAAIPPERHQILLPLMHRD